MLLATCPLQHSPHAQLFRYNLRPRIPLSSYKLGKTPYVRHHRFPVLIARAAESESLAGQTPPVHVINHVAVPTGVQVVKSEDYSGAVKPKKPRPGADGAESAGGGGRTGSGRREPRACAQLAPRPRPSTRHGGTARLVGVDGIDHRKPLYRGPKGCTQPLGHLAATAERKLCQWHCPSCSILLDRYAGPDRESLSNPLVA